MQPFDALSYTGPLPNVSPLSFRESKGGHPSPSCLPSPQKMNHNCARDCQICISAKVLWKIAIFQQLLPSQLPATPVAINPHQATSPSLHQRPPTPFPPRSGPASAHGHAARRPNSHTFGSKPIRTARHERHEQLYRIHPCFSRVPTVSKHGRSLVQQRDIRTSNKPPWTSWVTWCNRS